MYVCMYIMHMYIYMYKLYICIYNNFSELSSDFSMNVASKDVIKKDLLPFTNKSFIKTFSSTRLKTLSCF